MTVSIPAGEAANAVESRVLRSPTLNLGTAYSFPVTYYTSGGFGPGVEPIPVAFTHSLH
jgi:hypothetical protein